jgi:hypothetical protein
MDYLRQAVAKGWASLRLMEKDPDVEPLRAGGLHAPSQRPQSQRETAVIARHSFCSHFAIRILSRTGLTKAKQKQITGSFTLLK